MKSNKILHGRWVTAIACASMMIAGQAAQAAVEFLD